MSFTLPVLLLALVGSRAGALGSAPLVRHPESMSRSQVLVQGQRATVELQFQTLSLLEVLPELDLISDGALDVDELTRARPAIDAYLLEKFRLLRVDGELEQPLAGTVAALAVQDAAELGPFELQNLSVRLEFAGEGALDVLVVESVLFHETNPWHRDFSSLTWNGDNPVPHLFEGNDVRWRFEPAHVRRAGVLARFARLGGQHAFGADHAAMLLALLVIARRWSGLVGSVTAFAAANALTLTLTATGRISLPARLVELTTALAIAYQACDNLLRKEVRDAWLEAGLFGALHGLGFAGYLADDLAGEALFRPALVGFSLGLGLGQLGIAALCMPLVLLLFRSWRRSQAASDPPAGLVPPLVRRATSLVVALLGFFWFVERAGWLPGG